MKVFCLFLRGILEFSDFGFYWSVHELFANFPFKNPRKTIKLKTNRILEKLSKNRFPMPSFKANLSQNKTQIPKLILQKNKCGEKSCQSLSHVSNTFGKSLTETSITFSSSAQFSINKFCQHKKKENPC